MTLTAGTQTVPSAARRLELTDEERTALSRDFYNAKEQKTLSSLLGPFEEIYLKYTIRNCEPAYQINNLRSDFRFCARMMLELDCTFWAFDWDKLLAWKKALLERKPTHFKIWHQTQKTRWARVTATLFFMGVLPYSEEIHTTYPRQLAEKWLGKEETRRIEERFMAAATSMGYVDKRTLHKCVVGSLLHVMVFTGKTDIADITVSDLQNWLSHTNRSKRVANASVVRIQKILASMGLLGGEIPQLSTNSETRFAWGRTAPALIPTFDRFLSDFGTVRDPATVRGYRIALRRFGDWLGKFDPALQSLADLRRHHIEAFKKAVSEMRCGDYTSTIHEFNTVNFGLPMSKAHQVRTLSCVKTFCEHIEMLEYPDRPGRKLWMHGDVPRVDYELPRNIPDTDWRLLTQAVECLTPEQAAEHKLPLPFERSRAVLSVLTECGMRAGEICRLTTGCILTAIDPETGQETYWLRVPLGKEHNDRMIPVRPQLVKSIDDWMRVRGQQPLGFDKRTKKKCDFLFTWQGFSLSTHLLNQYIARLCHLAGTKQRYTSHSFRHTLAVIWREHGMKIETIRRMLGHKDTRVTMRYAAIMPPQLRQEFEDAYARIDEEHRATAQIRVLLSPEAHMEAQVQWRESLFVDLGVGWCGLGAYHPCEARLACTGCPNFIPDKERLPLLENQRVNLIELRGLTGRTLPAARQQQVDRELSTAIDGLSRNIDLIGGP
jgi:site-specific recombinase XerD